MNYRKICAEPWAPFDRYHRFPWQASPRDGELEYLRVIFVGKYEVRPAEPASMMSNRSSPS